MTTQTNDRSSFLTSLGEEIHSIANFFCQQKADFTTAERVYLDTLAVYAVNEWLQSLGIQTDWETRVRENFSINSRVKVADLMVKEKGKLACYPVLPDENFIEIKEEIFPDKIGYIFVEIDEEMSEAKLLGGVREILFSPFPISQLWPLNVLQDYLIHNSWKNQNF